MTGLYFHKIAKLGVSRTFQMIFRIVELNEGCIAMDWHSKDLVENEGFKEFYPGLNRIGKRKSYSEVKHCKRRERWFA